MFNSIKAISLGAISLLILELVNQLVLIMAAVGFSSLIKSYPGLMPWSQTFTYAMGAAGHFVVMAITGIIVAMASIKKQAYRSTVFAVFIGSGISLYLSLRDDIFTPVAFIFVVSGILFALLGSWFWLRREAEKSVFK